MSAPSMSAPTPRAVMVIASSCTRPTSADSSTSLVNPTVGWPSLTSTSRRAPPAPRSAFNPASSPPEMLVLPAAWSASMAA